MTISVNHLNLLTSCMLGYNVDIDYSLKISMTREVSMLGLIMGREFRAGFLDYGAISMFTMDVRPGRCIPGGQLLGKSALLRNFTLHLWKFIKIKLFGSKLYSKQC